MRTLLITATIGVCATVGLAQNESQSDAAEQAKKLLSEVIETYATADALTDTMTITYEMPGMPQDSVTGRILLDNINDNARFEIQSTTLTALDGQFYLESADLKKKYLQTEITTDFATTLKNLFGGSTAGLPFHFLISQTTLIDELADSLANGAIINLEVAGVESVKTESGEPRTVVTMTGHNEGELKIHVDPNTNLIMAANVSFVSPMPDNPQGATIQMNVEYQPKLHEELPEAIMFDPAGRNMVSTVEDLQPTPLKVGDTAPNFTLTSNTGEAVTLEELRGNVVVLDFWATWCGPCIKGLPELQKFHAWAEDSEKPVRVFAVNTFQREKTADDRKAAALRFWEQREFTMKTLLDLESAVAGEFGVSGIPATFVIGPDGKVAAVHVGFYPNMVEMLKDDAAEAIEDSASAG